MAHILYGTITDGPYLVEVPDDRADEFAAQVGGTRHESVEAALAAWRDDTVGVHGPGDTLNVEADAAYPEGEPPAPEKGTGDPQDGPTFGTETPAESSQPVEQR